MLRIRSAMRKAYLGVDAVLEMGPAPLARQVGSALWESRHTIIATAVTEVLFAIMRGALRSAWTMVRPRPKRAGKIIPFPKRW